jgi:hypothetical protein
LKTDALRYLADALSEDIAATPESKILAEERDDSARRPPFALAFEDLLVDAKALACKRGTVPGISRADTLGADMGSSDSQAPATQFDHLVDRNAVLRNAARAAATGPERLAYNWGPRSRQTILALLGPLVARFQLRTAVSAIATLLLVGVLTQALYERFAEHPGGFSPLPVSPLVQREEFPAPDSATPLPQAVPQLPRVSTLPEMPTDLRLRQPQIPLGTSETASAFPGAQQTPDSAQQQLPANGSRPRQPSPGTMPPVDPAVRRIASFLNSYDGGDCFLIIPLKIAEGDTRIEVYGGSRGFSAALDGEFARQNGFRAGISRHQVTEAQCGAVNFVRRLRNQSGTGRRLDIRTETLPSGPVLSGLVGGFSGENLELLLVGADGRVEKVTSLLTPSGPTRRNGQGGAQPQLLVAIVSGLPIGALKPAVLDKADRLFEVIFAETQQASNVVNAAMKYFKLE